MAFYETTFIARPDIASSEVSKLVENFSNIIGEFGGKLVRSEYWGLRNLAYIIKKSKRGHYSMMLIDAPAEALNEMERKMRLNEDVLRYMTIRLEEIPEGPSPLVARSENAVSASE